MVATIAAATVIGLSSATHTPHAAEPKPGEPLAVAIYRTGPGWDGLAFEYPPAWHARAVTADSHFTLRKVSLGNAPASQLGPDDVAVAISVNAWPLWTLAGARGKPLIVDGHRGKLATGMPGCELAGGERGLVLTIARGAYSWFELQACIAGPDADPAEEQVQALIDSIRFGSLDGG